MSVGTLPCPSLQVERIEVPSPARVTRHAGGAGAAGQRRQTCRQARVESLSQTSRLCHLAPGPQAGPQALSDRHSCGAQGDGGDGRKEQCGWAGGRPANIAGRPAESMEEGLHEGRVPPGGVVLPSRTSESTDPSPSSESIHPSHSSESCIRITHPSRTSESYVRVKWASAVGTTLNEGRAPPGALHVRMHARLHMHTHARTHTCTHARTLALAHTQSLARTHTYPQWVQQGICLAYTSCIP
jgi:hypothetical protein